MILMYIHVGNLSSDISHSGYRVKFNTDTPINVYKYNR